VSAPEALKPCGKLKAAGKTWTIGVNRVPCAAARSVVRRLAGKPSPLKPPPGQLFAGVYKGKFAGLNCSGTPVGRKPTVIECGSDDLTKTLLATAD
jgi:hypothetical protein